MVVLSRPVKRFGQLLEWMKRRGLLWTTLYILRSIVLKFSRKILKKLEVSLLSIERQKFLTGDRTISSLFNTVDDNLILWNKHDWSKYGEEWTEDVQEFRGLDPHEWKDMLVNQMMMKYLDENLNILEVGPGAGRWTEILQKKASTIILADISEKCLSICKDRFQNCSNVEYYLIKDRGLDCIESESIDYIWSYDVFVHINPTDTEQYIVDFQRVLKSGGVAIIHHPGASAEDIGRIRRKGFRSWIDGQFFAHLVVKHDMKIVEQDNTLAHRPSDLITVFMKP